MSGYRVGSYLFVYCPCLVGGLVNSGYKLGNLDDFLVLHFTIIFY